ncbi:hypothetical protein M378DRAFT_159834 [Amanita muscaria Koide BX008]|uniref:Uncharacterized protein n=1 Tax=Amanita muscaria (strain Koide BX008) TaxID=946122 RepID=A0A0C2WZY6_AMAMK|nr:hypothetical protein M378DRAFT_159834 [Amanita muscaria Koide BX008]
MGGGLARQTIKYRQFSEPSELMCSTGKLLLVCIWVYSFPVVPTRRRELIHVYSREPHATSNAEPFSFSLSGCHLLGSFDWWDGRLSRTFPCEKMLCLRFHRQKGERWHTHASDSLKLNGRSNTSINPHR